MADDKSNGPDGSSGVVRRTRVVKLVGDAAPSDGAERPSQMPFAATPPAPQTSSVPPPPDAAPAAEPGQRFDLKFNPAGGAPAVPVRHPTSVNMDRAELDRRHIYVAPRHATVLQQQQHAAELQAELEASRPIRAQQELRRRRIAIALTIFFVAVAAAIVVYMLTRLPTHPAV